MKLSLCSRCCHKKPLNCAIPAVFWGPLYYNYNEQPPKYYNRKLSRYTKSHYFGQKTSDGEALTLETVGNYSPKRQHRRETLGGWLFVAEMNHRQIHEGEFVLFRVYGSGFRSFRFFVKALFRLH